MFYNQWSTTNFEKATNDRKPHLVLVFVFDNNPHGVSDTIIKTILKPQTFFSTGKQQKQEIDSSNK